MSATTTPAPPVTVRAPNGVTWTRRPDVDTTPQQFLVALQEFVTMHAVTARWNWWREGQEKEERQRIERIVFGWDNGAPESTPEEAEAFADKFMRDHRTDMARDHRNRRRRAVRQYDADRETKRLRVLRLESDAAFFSHVAAKPASPEQRDAAQQRADAARQQAASVREDIGRDLESVLDVHGYTPAERREHHLRSHMDYWRHRLLREWHGTDKRRFKALLEMSPLSAEQMCSECEAPAAWHDYDISIRLFRPAPEPGSQAEAIARAMPGWWERCTACTAYQLEHRWGGKGTLPDFTGEQYVAMLPPLLRTLFGPAPQPRPRAKRAPAPNPLEVIPGGLPLGEVLSRLAQAQERFPDAEVRRGARDGWELWPIGTGSDEA